MSQALNPETIRQVFKACQDDPDAGSRTVAERAGVGKSTVNRLKSKARDLGLDPGEIVYMSDESIEAKFGVRVSAENFVIPDWEQILNYLETPRKWGIKMNSMTNAWLNIYLKNYFPTYVDGMPRPKGCMSLRTFCRRYEEYLKDQGISRIKHNPNADMNFGPASMLEIDTIGDRYSIITPSGELIKMVLFTAVHKYSGRMYVEAMTSNTEMAWTTAIINALYDAGGACECIRCDNDVAICIHGDKKKGTKTRLKPGLAFLLKDLGITADLCPTYSPTCYRNKFFISRPGLKVLI